MGKQVRLLADQQHKLCCLDNELFAHLEQKTKNVDSKHKIVPMSFLKRSLRPFYV